MAAILKSVDGRRREMSGDVDSVTFKSGLVENVGVEVEIASLSKPFKSYCRFRFSGRHLGFPVEGDVGFSRGCTVEKARTRKWG